MEREAKGRSYGKRYLKAWIYLWYSRIYYKWYYIISDRLEVHQCSVNIDTDLNARGSEMLLPRPLDKELWTAVLRLAVLWPAVLGAEPAIPLLHELCGESRQETIAFFKDIIQTFCYILICIYIQKPFTAIIYQYCEYHWTKPYRYLRFYISILLSGTYSESQ